MQGVLRALSIAGDEPATADPAAAVCVRRDVALFDTNQQATVLRFGGAAAASDGPTNGDPNGKSDRYSVRSIVHPELAIV